MVKLKKGLVGWFLFFFCRQKKNQKDRRPTPIKSTLFTKNFKLATARTIKFF